MRWAEGMYLMTKPDVIDMLREYERLRHWRRTKLFFDIRRSPVLAWIKGTMVEKRTMEDLNAVARARVRAELDRVDQLEPPEEESSATPA